MKLKLFLITLTVGFSNFAFGDKMETAALISSSTMNTVNPLAESRLDEGGSTGGRGGGSPIIARESLKNLERYREIEDEALNQVITLIEMNRAPLSASILALLKADVLSIVASEKLRVLDRCLGDDGNEHALVLARDSKNTCITSASFSNLTELTRLFSAMILTRARNDEVTGISDQQLLAWIKALPEVDPDFKTNSMESIQKKQYILALDSPTAPLWSTLKCSLYRQNGTVVLAQGTEIQSSVNCSRVSLTGKIIAKSNRGIYFCTPQN